MPLLITFQLGADVIFTLFYKYQGLSLLTQGFPPVLAHAPGNAQLYVVRLKPVAFVVPGKSLCEPVHQGLFGKTDARQCFEDIVRYVCHYATVFWNGVASVPAASPTILTNQRFAARPSISISCQPYRLCCLQCRACRSCQTCQQLQQASEQQYCRSHYPSVHNQP